MEVTIPPANPPKPEFRRRLSVSAIVAQDRRSTQQPNSDTDDATDDETSGDKDTEEKPKKSISLKSIFIRSLTASCLALFFLGLLQLGHFYCILLGVLTQTEIYRELVNVRYVEAKQRSMPAYRTLQWSWFFVAMLFVYGETLHDFFSEHSRFLYLTVVTQHSLTIAFIMYCVIFAASVLTLKKNLLRFQISQYMWSIAIVCLVVYQCKFFATNTLHGLFWFVFPMVTVSMNDVSAYFCGITLGRRFIKAPFWSLSPNKTWEGFIGAGICTMIFSFFFPALLSQWTWFTCPAEDLHFSLLSLPKPLHCIPNPVFTEKYMQTIPLLHIQIQVLPIQIHGLAYGLFASLVAPVGGFFASAIKRAYKLKDFDSFMPGHGGMMDRMDCQLLMMTFTSFHYYHYIAPAPSLARLQYLIRSLSLENQILLFNFLSELLKNLDAEMKREGLSATIP